MELDAADHQILYMDAPVAGSKVPAEKGTLTFFVGGAEAVYKKIKPVLLTMGSKVMYAGESGMGSAHKMIVNLMLAQAMAGYAEAIHLGRALNLPEKFLTEILPDLPIAAPFLKMKADKIKKGDFSAEFPLVHMLKDLEMVTKTAYEKKVPLPVSHIAHELYALAVAGGSGRKDFSAVVEFLEKNKKS
jgi:3-hydroxyisobutyrate dehydrogenase/glyoxylate/succinic semialdehyde reductase